MSEFYEDDEVDQQQDINMEKEQQTTQPIQKERYKSTKDQTKRREQAIANLAKGRATRLANLARKKEMSITPSKRQSIKMEYYDESASSSDSEEFILERKSKRSKSIPIPKQQRSRPDPYDERMNRLEAMMANSIKRKKERPGPPAVKPRVIDPVLQSLKKVLLDLYI